MRRKTIDPDATIDTALAVIDACPHNSITMHQFAQQLSDKRVLSFGVDAKTLVRLLTEHHEIHYDPKTETISRAAKEERDLYRNERNLHRSVRRYLDTLKKSPEDAKKLSYDATSQQQEMYCAIDALYRFYGNKLELPFDWPSKQS